MRIFALLSYWDEDPAHLRRTVGSLAGFCDHLIAVDGRYSTFGAERTHDAFTQIEAVEQAADAAGLDSDVWIGVQWPSEVDKRAAMFARARECGATAEDWFLIIDADMALAEYTAEARYELEMTDADVAEVNWHDVQIDGKPCSTHTFRSLFRALPGLTVERAHYLYTVPMPDCIDGPRGTEPVMGRRFLWNLPDGHISPEPALDLTQHVTLHHYNSWRHPERRQRALDYYKNRDANRLETAGDWREP